MNMTNISTETLVNVRDSINEEIARREELQRVGEELISKVTEYLMLGGKLYNYNPDYIMDAHNDHEMNPDPHHYDRINIR